MIYFWISLLCLSPVWAHQSLLSGSDNHVKWTRPQVPLIINIGEQNYKNIIEQSVSEWNQYSDVKIIPNSNSASSNTISFKSNFPYGAGVLGITEVTHDNSGVIESAKILINADKIYSTSPAVTYLPYLGDVVTHELGHFLGMGHSEVLDSSMFYMSFKTQHLLAKDDIAGIRGKYLDSGFGRISGTIKGSGHIGVLGTHVQAISKKTGNAIGGISQEDGRFVINGLDINDTYYLYTSPLNNPANSPEYFSNSQKMFCPSAYEGSFFSECGEENKGNPAGINLTDTNPNIDIGAVTINCGYKTNIDYSQMKNAVQREPLILRKDSLAGWFYHPKPIDRSNDENGVQTSDTDVFNLNALDLFGNFNWEPGLELRISLITHAFGAALDTSLKITSPSQIESSDLKSSVLENTNNKIIKIPLGPNYHEYTLIVGSTKLHGASYSHLFPVVPGKTGTTTFPYLLSIGIYRADGSSYFNTEARLSDNSSCLEGPFTKRVQATRTKIEKLSSRDAQMVAPSCGTIDPPSNSGPGSSLMLMTMGFMLSLLVSIATKSRKKFLS